ncbi:hypothetical protein [Streptomyces sp. NPDC059009]|uniref:hypothetical protein n=1 Tax=Streptomyces sp. NPDC059009 TaxID=3346694 RepID=UPI0036C16690
MSSDLKPPATRPLAPLATATALLLTLLALLTLLMFLTAPASTAAAPEPSPGTKIAKALRTSPVYVDPAYARAVPPARQKQLARQIARTGLPIKVVLIPLTKGDAFDGEADTLGSVLRDRIDQRDLILVTSSETSQGDLRGFEWPDGRHQASDAANAVFFMDDLRDASLGDRTAKAIEIIKQGNGKAVYEKETEKLHGDTAGSSSGSSLSQGPTAPDHNKDKDEDEDEGIPWLPLLLALAALAAITTTGTLYYRRHRRTHSSTSPFAFPQAAFAAARAADEAELRRRAEAEILALGEAAQAAAPSTTPGLQKALDAYDAAGTVLDGARGLADLAGVLALVAEGRDALPPTPHTPHKSPSPLPLCFFNPLHGRATRTVRWRPLGHRTHLKVAACPDCTQSVRAHRPPEVLTDTPADTGTGTGRTSSGPHEVPYFEVDPDHSVWAATGYGSLLKDPEDSLAARVGRGDFSRGRTA